jgi:hypothetical protein
MTTGADSPIILIGAARSGTKFLRDLIGAAPGFAAVPYDVNYVWRTGNEGLDHDELDPVGLTEARRGTIRASIKALARRSDDRDTIVEKTVSNTLRVPFVDAIFPDARFLHLVRDGRAVTESALRMWKAPPDRRGLWRKLKELPPGQYSYVWWFARNYIKGRLSGREGGQVWGPRYRGILDDLARLPLEAVVARQWARSVTAATRDLAALPPERSLTIRYEDLLNNRESIAKLADFVGLGETEGLAARFDSTVDRDNSEKWRNILTGETLTTIENEAMPALRIHGYA